MISVQDIVDRMESILDAESSDRYTFERDYKPAINSSVEWLQAVFNKAFADKKLTEENLRELLKVVVFQTNQFSRVNIDQIPDSIWSIIRVNPEPSVYPSTAVVNATSTPEESQLRTDLTYVRSKFSAKRLSQEQWEENIDNIFEAGNERMLNSFKSYAYLNMADYNSSGYASGGQEIEVRPYVPNSFLGISYLKYPTPVQAVTDNVEFPESLKNLVYQKALNFVSFKQGDQTNLYAVTAQDVATLAKLMM